MQKYLPDPFIFCAILTFLVFLGSLTFTKQSPLDIIEGMERRFWSLLAFSIWNGISFVVMLWQALQL